MSSDPKRQGWRVFVRKYRVPFFILTVVILAWFVLVRNGQSTGGTGYPSGYRNQNYQ